VTVERVPLARAAGAAGVAVVSAICGRRHPGEAARLLRLAWDAAEEAPAAAPARGSLSPEAS
jgi:thiamine-phosphate pyrophosphorylase